MKSVVFRREKLYIAQKHRNLVAAYAHKVVPFSATNELGLWNYLCYLCAKFGENCWKIAPISIDKRENFVIAEVGCCCCDSPATRLLSSVIQVEEVCDRGRVIPQILHCELCGVALTVEQMLYGVWCHSTLRTNIWYATGDAGLVTVQEPTVTGTQLGKCGMDWPREQIFERWDIRWWSRSRSPCMRTEQFLLGWCSSCAIYLGAHVPNLVKIS